jgi:uncharacterized membrane protein
MRASFVAIALALSACNAPAPASAPTAATSATLPAESPRWENAGAAGVDFRAVGQEPGWLLDIYTSDRIVLEWDYGEQRAAFALPEPTYPVEGQTRYETQADGRALTIVISRAPCQDVMSGEAFPASVEVTIDDRTLQGCGRSV